MTSHYEMASFISIWRHLTRHSSDYSFLAAALAPFLAGSGFWDLVMAAARLRAALVRSFLYLPLTRTAFTLCRLLLGPAFMVVATRPLPGLLPLLAFLVVNTNLQEQDYGDGETQHDSNTNPLLSAAALMPTALALTSPLYLWAFLLVRLQASVEKGFLTPLFFSRKLLLLRMTAQAMSDETIVIVYTMK